MSSSVNQNVPSPASGQLPSSGTTQVKTMLEIETAGSMVEALAGVAVIVLSVIGLARNGTGLMMPIAAIVLGAALLAQGGAIAAEYSRLLTLITGGALGAVELGGGMTVEILAGVAAVVLGILALVGIAPTVLIAAAVITVGAALIFASSGFQRLNTLKAQVAGVSEIAQRVAQATVTAAVAAEVLIGGGAVVLGILALTISAYSAILTLVGLLILGVAVAISSTALTGRMIRMFNVQQPSSR